MIRLKRRFYDYEDSTRTVKLLQDDARYTNPATFLRAALTVGKQSALDLLHFEEWSRLELLWRYAMIAANLKLELLPDGHSALRISPAFQALDGSEKGMVSYLLGLTVAKLVAEFEYGVAWLMHLDVYSKPHPYISPVHDVKFIENADGRPDLIGKRFDGSWAVFEAKGRTSYATNDLRISAKEQTQLIATINGADPTARIATVSQLVPAGLKFDIVDPIEALPNAVPLSVPNSMLLSEAYRSVLGLLRGADTSEIQIRGRRFRSAHIKNIDLTIGLPVDIDDQFDRQGQVISEDALDRIQAVLAEPFSIDPDEGDFAQVSIGADGTFLGLGRGWDPDGIWQTPPISPLTGKAMIQPEAKADGQIEAEPEMLLDWYRSYDVTEEFEPPHKVMLIEGY